MICILILTYFREKSKQFYSISTEINFSVNALISVDNAAALIYNYY